MDIMFIILILIHISSGVILPFKTFRANTESIRTFNQITVDSNTGHVYVAGDNTIYKLTSGLTYMDDSDVDSPSDRPRCSSSDDNSGCSGGINNTATVLEIHPEERYLLHCGTSQYGVCSVHYLDINMNELTITQMNNSLSLNLLGSSQSTVAFFGSMFNMGQQLSALYVAVSYDHRPLHLAPVSVSARQLVHDQDNELPKMDYVFEDPSSMLRSGIDIDNDVKKQFIVTYVHGFQVGSY